MKPVLPRKIRKALMEIIEYSWHDERASFKEHLAEHDGDGSGHIFTYLLQVDNWIHGTNYKWQDHLPTQSARNVARTQDSGEETPA